ncbi:uncharacterized protein TNCV_315681 [Trichonephila clavipes]|nr:uncharacterized protein TNCV_315681 [Trichonephila clavipes]
MRPWIPMFVFSRVPLGLTLFNGSRREAHRSHLVDELLESGQDRRKSVSAEAIEKVALQLEEDKASNVQASTSVRLVAEALDLPRSTVQNIMRIILRYYPNKLQLVQELLPHDFETRHLFSLQFLARLEVDPE